MGLFAPTAEEIARAWWKEKDRRDEEARAKAEIERREAEEKAETAALTEELGEALLRGEEL